MRLGHTTRVGAVSERTKVDSHSGRQPTSHERLAGRPWDASYLDGPPPWDIGRPQPAILRLAGEGAFAGAVLDAGCGTGEHALLVASLGLDVLGVDVAETAVSIAREKAEARGMDADFEVADALHLDRLGRVFARIDANGACGLLPQLTQHGQLGVDHAKGGTEGVQQAFAGLGRCDTAGGAGQKAQAELLLKPADRMAQRRLRDAQLRCGSCKTALLRDGQEGQKIIQIAAIH